MVHQDVFATMFKSQHEFRFIRHANQLSNIHRNQQIQTLPKMDNFKVNDGKIIEIGEKDYKIKFLSDNTDFIDIYQLKSKNSTVFFRASGTGPDVRFYIFGKRETSLDEIKRVMEHIGENYK